MSKKIFHIRSSEEQPPNISLEDQLERVAVVEFYCRHFLMKWCPESPPCTSIKVLTTKENASFWLKTRSSGSWSPDKNRYGSHDVSFCSVIREPVEVVKKTDEKYKKWLLLERKRNEHDKYCCLSIVLQWKITNKTSRWIQIGLYFHF